MRRSARTDSRHISSATLRIPGDLPATLYSGPVSESGPCGCRHMAGSAANGGQLEYAVGGVSVRFPCKPYPTQMAMMAKVSTSLHSANLIFNMTGGLMFSQILLRL